MDEGGVQSCVSISNGNEEFDTISAAVILNEAFEQQQHKVITIGNQQIPMHRFGSWVFSGVNDEADVRRLVAEGGSVVAVTWAIFKRYPQISTWLSNSFNSKRLIFSFDVKRSLKNDIISQIVNRKMLTAVQEELQNLSKDIPCIQNLKLKLIHIQPDTGTVTKGVSGGRSLIAGSSNGESVNIRNSIDKITSLIEKSERIQVIEMLLAASSSNLLIEDEDERLDKVKKDVGKICESLNKIYYLNPGAIKVTITSVEVTNPETFREASGTAYEQANRFRRKGKKSMKQATRNLDEARKMFDEAILLDKSNPKRYIWKADVLFKQKEFDECQNTCTLAMKICNNRRGEELCKAKILAIQGRVKLAKYRPQEAIHLYVESLRLHESEDVKILHQDCINAINQIADDNNSARFQEIFGFLLNNSLMR